MIKKLISMALIVLLTALGLLGIEFFVLGMVGKERLSKTPFLKKFFVIGTAEVKYVEQADPRYTELENMIKGYQQKKEALEKLDENKQGEFKELMQEAEIKWEEIKKLQAELGSKLIVYEATHWKNVRTLAKNYETMEAPDAAKIFEGFDDETFASLLVVMKSDSVAGIMTEYINLGAGTKEEEKYTKRIVKIHKLMERIVVPPAEDE